MLFIFSNSSLVLRAGVYHNNIFAILSSESSDLMKIAISPSSSVNAGNPARDHPKAQNVESKTLIGIFLISRQIELF